MWYRYLRNCSVRFLRQKPIGDYIVDFYCPKLHLVIELDGSQHYLDKGIRYDNKRTRELKEHGIKTVIRVPNNEISHNLSGVVEFIEVISVEPSVSPNGLTAPFTKGSS